jgi:hypothetical protein
MPVTHPLAYLRKREREAERRKERLRADPEYRKRRAAIDAKADAKRRRDQPASERPFTGCDGEGIRRGAECSYALFRMGERELYAGDRRLETPDLLAFILDHPRDELLVGFAFEYDVNNILFDVPRVRAKPDRPSRLERVLAQSMAYVEGSAAPYRGHGWTWLDFDGHPTYGVIYLPRNYLRVCLASRDPKTGRLAAAPGSVRTIYDVFGNYQTSFLATLHDWLIGAEHWERIKQNKAGRADFSTITPEIKRYCALECSLLADLMEQFRAVTIEAGIRPKRWNGAGKLAAALLTQHGVITRQDVAKFVPPDVRELARQSYFGGRFEITRVGEICEPVYEHDINSAYPAAMQSLPCLAHGRWIETSGKALTARLADPTALFIAPAKFAHAWDAHLCGLPHRDPKGKIYWPKMGIGVFWSPEMRSAMMLGAKIECSRGWLYEKACSCKPFAWAERLFDIRRKLGKSLKGKPLKLALNSLYGKLVQRVGSPRWANIVWGSLITATTRAAINHAISLAGASRVIMIATDAVYVTGGPIAGLDVGKRLGQWGRKRYARLTIVKPGFYWPPKPRTRAWRLRSRGMPGKVLEGYVPAFQKAWRAYLAEEKRRSTDRYVWGGERGIIPPKAPRATVDITLPIFVSLRLALHEGRPELGCQWIERTKSQSFNWTDKRAGATFSPDGKSLILGAKNGNQIDPSSSYDAATGKLGVTMLDAWGQIEFEAMPDPIDTGPPFV